MKLPFFAVTFHTVVFAATCPIVEKTVGLLLAARSTIKPASLIELSCHLRVPFLDVTVAVRFDGALSGIGVEAGVGVTVGVGIGVGVALGLGACVGVTVGIGVGVTEFARTTKSVTLCAGTVVVIALPTTLASARRTIWFDEVNCQACDVLLPLKLAILTLTCVPVVALLTTITVKALSVERTAANDERLSGFGTVAETPMSPKPEFCPS